MSTAAAGVARGWSGAGDTMRPRQAQRLVGGGQWLARPRKR